MELTSALELVGLFALVLALVGLFVLIGGLTFITLKN
jgi:hypothetical protein